MTTAMIVISVVNKEYSAIDADMNCCVGGAVTTEQKNTTGRLCAGGGYDVATFFR
ncbi:MAG: hypothetical protein ROR55_23960 [Devosia sp.]